MTRTEELLALAEASIKERPARNRLYKLQDAANPETIKQLVELCRLQHVALIELSPCMYKECQQVQKETQDHAIAAFNKFEGGE